MGKATQVLLEKIPENSIFLAMRVGNEIKPIALSKDQSMIFKVMLEGFSEENPLNATKEGFQIIVDDKLDIAIEALTNISDPVKYLQKQAIKDGFGFDRKGAIEFSNNGNNISNIAKEALKMINNGDD